VEFNSGERGRVSDVIRCWLKHTSQRTVSRAVSVRTWRGRVEYTSGARGASRESERSADRMGDQRAVHEFAHVFTSWGWNSVEARGPAGIGGKERGSDREAAMAASGEEHRRFNHCKIVPNLNPQRIS